MNLKTFLIIFITVIITIVFMQNTDEITIKLLAWDVRISKVMILASMALMGFILGLLMGYRGKRKAIDAQNTLPTSGNSELSDDDRDYIK
ncbi:LapA family protein [Solitalea koreensis]|uniref:Lipopolysaccharide assembly protein A domain-containing protein n=1 Tax=Solitalea koreensis TaxID=543615 RepID=A0A521D8S4_9SPHI|nr:LapA family protein [Solitalea koreensis]SMO68108.1 Protein of unknown function [Solitalea koreensis]